MSKILEVKDLETSFFTDDGEVEAVRGISFGLQEGTITGIIGESGCGKSVTALSILRLLPGRGRIKAGEIRFEGTRLTALKEREMRKIRGNRISIIFQNPATALDPLYSIGNQMGEVISFHKKTNREETRAQCVRLLEMVGLSDPEARLRAYPHELSGGMCQRVAVALALSCQPRLLLADEPTTALDVTMQIQILGLIRRLARQFNSAVLLITHDLSVIANICTRVIVMYGGKIMEEGEVRDIFSSPLHPYTKGLLQTVRDLERPAGGELFCIEGTPPSLLKPPEGCPFARRCPHAMQICRMAAPQVYQVGGHRAYCWLLDPECGGEL